MSYKLADGSLSTDYEVGDEFVVIGNAALASPGDIVVFNEDDGTRVPYFGDQRIRMAIYWYELAPTPETKRKVQARKPKPPAFNISSGDYIDSREFTREECERFCELAVESGAKKDGPWMYSQPIQFYYLLGWDERDGKIYACENAILIWSKCFTNNITTNFREFLGKEKGVEQFTKDDLKDGMRVKHRDGDVFYVCGDTLFADSYPNRESLVSYGEDMLSKHHSRCDIMKVTDRDGTVVFERPPEKRKVTFELTEEQERELRKQLGMSNG